MNADGAGQRADRATAERAREQARRMAEQLSPEQQDRLRQWAEGLMRERPDLAEKFAGSGADPGADQPPPGMSAQQDAANGNTEPNGEAQGAGPGDRPIERRDAGDGDGQGTDAGHAAGAPEQTAGRQPFTPSRTELVDARDAGAARPGATTSRDQVVAEWLAPPAPGTSRTAGPSAAERMRQAAKSAQQAVDDRSIPARYDRLVQRYFRRLPEKVAERAAAASPPASVPAQDAP